MPVPSTIADLSTTAASNSPAGSDAIGTSLDDYLRAIQAIIKADVSVGANISSASSITIPAAGQFFTVTGAVSIASIANSWTGRIVALKFASPLDLVHSSSLVLGASRTTVANDVAVFCNTASGVWDLIAYKPADGVLQMGGKAITGLALATSADLTHAASVQYVDQAISAAAIGYTGGPVSLTVDVTTDNGFSFATSWTPTTALNPGEAAFGYVSGAYLDEIDATDQVTHFVAVEQSALAGTLTEQSGFLAASSLASGTNIYGFRGDVAAASGRWNFYASGTANNAYAGKSSFGKVTAPTYTVEVEGVGHAFNHFEKSVALGAGVAIDVNSGSVFTKTITGSTTFTISNTPASGVVASFILELTNPSTNLTGTWWNAVKWAGNVTPTLTTTGKDVLAFYTIDGGATWNGFVLGLNIS
jgi:hypothetical protein